MQLSHWYSIFVEEDALRLEVAPPGGEPWQVVIPLSTVIRVCFQPGGFLESDTWYVFVRDREASYALPGDASGGDQLLEAFLSRDLIQAGGYLDAVREEKMVCWPPD